MTQPPIPVGTTVYVEADARLAQTPADAPQDVYFGGAIIGTVVGEMDSDGDYLVESVQGDDKGLVQYVGKAYVSVPVAAEEG